MIRALHWHAAPSAKVLEALPKVLWQRTDVASPAAGTAALMIYVALLFTMEELGREALLGHSLTKPVVTASYDDLHLATGLSRSLISQGLSRLVELELIQLSGSHQKRRYELSWSIGGWFKLPCHAIVAAGVILPFKNFTLRSKHELYALKIYLYLAARRDNSKTYTLSSYETIADCTKVPERHIRKALVVLSLAGLLTDISRDHDDDRVYGPNKYFLSGYQQFFPKASTPTAPAQKVVKQLDVLF